MRRTIKIELKVDYRDDDEKIQAVIDVCRESAKNIYVLASLLQSDRPPQIMLISDDVYEGVIVEDLKLGEES